MSEGNTTMIDLPDNASQLAMLDQPLRDLIAAKVKDATAQGLADLTHIVVITKADDPDAIIEALGFNPLFSRLDQTQRQPDWDWLERHEGWFELVFTIGNDGFALIVLVADDGGSLAMDCKA